MHGLVVAAIAAPDVAGREIVASPFDDGPPQRWSLSALSVASTALTCLEPDPHGPDDERRLAQVYQAINEWASRLAGDASSSE
ncbi:hypothetical protein OHA21_38760 [Actinoplanes sp. NBC_00393]|uniref:hypothetical protein n=1 Tax=Actinoplanes sp. NBC_00393 TaxID=2975953 RepID=UPI002E230D1C